jgi:hypothetical protein
MSGLDEAERLSNDDILIICDGILDRIKENFYTCHCLCDISVNCSRKLPSNM